MGTEDNNPLLPKAHVAVPALTKAAPVLSCLLYMSVSVAMTFVNKYTMQVFPLSNIVMIMQMVATWMILQPLRPILGFKPFSLARARQFLYITIMYTASTAFALIGLKTLNVPMYNVIKRLTPMTVLVFKAFVRKQWPPVQIIASVVMVVVGCIVAGVGDLMFDLSGYVFCLLSCACQAAYLLLVEFKGNQAHAPVSSQEMLYYNCLTSLPLLMLLVWADGEAASLPGAYATGIETHGAFWLWTAMLSCSFMGCLLNYALFWCTTTNTALTTTIVGVLKGVVSVGLGFVLLGGVPFSPLNVIGISLNTAGGIWYAQIKYSTAGNRSKPG
ncbi:hypothetical protein DUNSADRAFT_4992 [Dunaliella salina]|uniref:Sugar phosphate transporter domain-containing protein n=1 Tax=Dunaliella salina TaxID=3046 RepID=A0ABQ7FUI0_DUNSA|nr:hypothetical protein DUNSADRAFT_4992 [Dunaliella salina]|eukprot:KAF5826064.1 hypothetical protein DUNSADRAFT_4992 [Dunaliella salina]